MRLLAGVEPPRGAYRHPRQGDRRDEEDPDRSHAQHGDESQHAADTIVERRVRATTGTSAIKAGRTKTTSTDARSLARRDSWLDVQEEIPVDVVEQEEVETTGAKARAAPVAAAVPKVSVRQLWTFTSAPTPIRDRGFRSEPLRNEDAPIFGSTPTARSGDPAGR